MARGETTTMMSHSSIARKKVVSGMVMAWAKGAQHTLRNQRIYPTMAFILTSGASLVVYTLTITPDFTWQYHGADGGELMAAAVTLGIPHPPGYPLYVLFGRLVGQIDLGPVAYRFHLFSAFCMALSAGIVAHLVTNLSTAGQNQSGIEVSLSPRKMEGIAPLYLGLATGMGLAFLPLVWQQAIIAEVYAINMLFVSLVLWQALRQDVTHAALRTGLFLGLAVTSHLTSLLLFPLCLFVVQRRQWPRLVAGLAMGLTPFLALPWLGAGNSPIIWGAPTTLRGWWWLVSAEIYRPNVFGLQLSSWGSRLLAWSAEPTLWICAALLLWLFWRKRLVNEKFGSAFISLASTTGLYMLYAFTYNAPDALVFTLPALAMVFLLTASTVRKPSALHLLVPIALLAINFQQSDLRDTTSARALVESSLLSAPENALILTSGDRATFSLWYLQFVEGKREDVIVVDRDLFAFDWYRVRLARAHPSLSGLEVDDIVNFRKLNKEIYPLCVLEIDLDNNKQTHCLGEIT